MEELRKLKYCILCFSILIALLSFTQYYAKWSREKAEINERFVSTPFYLAHVLDPDADGYQFTSWTYQDWMAWLNRREILHERAWRIHNGNVKRKSPLNQKPLNSVIIGSPSQVINAFGGRRYPYDAAGSSDNSKRNEIFWSESLFHSFIFHRKGNGKLLRVFRCPPMYVAVALLTDGLPTHLEEHAKKREMRSYKVKVSDDCIEIK